MKTIAMEHFIALYAPDMALLDVREPSEYAEGHVPGAVLVPLGQLDARIAEVPRGRPLYVICRSGRRSLTGVQTLQRHGIEGISVDEGTLGWIARGHAVEAGAVETGDGPR